MGKRALYTFPEWQKKAWAGAVAESTEGFHHAYCVLMRPSGIACPNVNTMSAARPNICGSNMWDTNLVIECGVEVRRIMVCETCGFALCRLFGRDDRMGS